jgi:hypothetical protein
MEFQFFGRMVGYLIRVGWNLVLWAGFFRKTKL